MACFSDGLNPPSTAQDDSSSAVVPELEAVFQDETTSSHDHNSGSLHLDMSMWKQRVHEWYPDLEKQTYFLPTLLFNRQHHEQQEIAGQPVAVLQCPVDRPPSGSPQGLFESNIREDSCQRLVRRCFEKIAETHKGVMFVISCLNYRAYLGEPCYAETAKLLRRPVDLKKMNQDRGDFDVLIIHRSCGILVGEIKAIGKMFPSLPQTRQQQDNKVAEKLGKAIKQLNKSKVVIEHIVSDRPAARRPRVHGTVMFPYITMSQLQRVLNNNEQLRQDLGKCVGIDTSEDPSTRCLTWEAMNSPEEWWQCWLTRIGTDPAMTNCADLYLDLVSRFGGPATTVRVLTSSKQHMARFVSIRNLTEAVLETGWRFSRLVLHPRQVDILHQSEPLVYLSGPPGTGKTIMLVLKGLDWLRNGADVHVVSTWGGSLAASYMIVLQLEQLAGTGDKKRIHHWTCNLKVGDETAIRKEVERQVEELVKMTKNKPLCVIVDEASWGRGFTDFCSQLKSQARQLFLWTASFFPENRPALLTQRTVEEPLRTPPNITEEVKKSRYIGQEVPSYTVSAAPLPANGPLPRVVLHGGQGHAVDDPRECVRCGEEVARILQRELAVAQKTDSSSQPVIQYGDVFLLTDFVHGFRDTELGTSGIVIHKACGMIRGLRESGVPVTVIKFGNADAAHKVATMRVNEVVAAGCDSVLGLERTVIVWVDFGLRELATMYSPSRSTAHLVLVRKKKATD